MKLYKPLVLFNELPFTIETIFAFGDFVLVGTREGHLLYYKIEIFPIISKGSISYHRKSLEFSKKPIIQIEAIPDHKILVSLSDDVILIHNLQQKSIPLIGKLKETKGAIFFLLETNRLVTFSGETRCIVRMVVAVKKSLMFFFLKNKKFLELRSNIRLPDKATSAAWCLPNMMIVALGNSLIEIDILRGTVKEFLPRVSNCLLTSLSFEDNIGLSIEKTAFILQKNLKPSSEHFIRWTDRPKSIADDLLFLGGLQPNSKIEIFTNCFRDQTEQVLVETIDLSAQVKQQLEQISDWVYRPGQWILNSQRDIIMLKIVSWEEQIEFFQIKNFHESAIKMIELNSAAKIFWKSDKKAFDFVENEKLKFKVCKNFALDLFFRQHKFTKAIRLFKNLDTDPLGLIALFPGLLTEELRCQQLKSVFPIPFELEGTVLKQALKALTTYLIEIRTDLEEKREEIFDDQLQKLQTIVDNSLLKCYIQIDESLITLFLKNKNYCDFKETMEALIKNHKYDQLVFFYKIKGLHRMALKLLQQQAKNESESSSYFRSQLIDYLKELGFEHLDLLFKYSVWLLRKHPTEGLTIFTDDKYIDYRYVSFRIETMHYLERIDIDLVITYLEHCIFEWNEELLKFHDTLISKYREKIQPLMVAYLADLDDRKNSIQNLKQIFDEKLRPTRAGQEPGALGHLRTKLIWLLDYSSHYSTVLLPTFFLHDGLFEELAIVMGKIGRYREALMIYIYVLNDLQQAEKFCLKQLDKQENLKLKALQNCEVFFQLFELCLFKPKKNVFQQYQNHKVFQKFYSELSWLLPESVLNYLNSDNENNENLSLNVRVALAILTRHTNHIDLMKAIPLLSDQLPLSALAPILKKAKAISPSFNESKILMKLFSSQCRKLQSTRIDSERKTVVRIEKSDLCQTCKKKIGKCAFLRYPNNDIIHLGCRSSYESELNQLK